nr:MAG TPA: NADH dehydrogenase 1 alpha subcomplex subunit 3 [Caudoviricetes sp.]
MKRLYSLALSYEQFVHTSWGKEPASCICAALNMVLPLAEMPAIVSL